LRSQWASDKVKQETALRELQAALGLPYPPTVSSATILVQTRHRHRRHAGSCLVQGVPRKSDIAASISRRWRTKGPTIPSMREALTRRFRAAIKKPLTSDGDRARQKDQSETWRLLPDLLIVDGGKGSAQCRGRGAAGSGLFWARAGVRAGEAVRGDLPAGA
jgi:excinuclease ABC subunit C